MYVVRRSGSEGWQENYKALEDRKNCANVMLLRKFKKPISCFQNEFFSFLFLPFVSSMADYTYQ